MPILSLLSVALPVAGAVYAFRVLSKSSADTVGGAIGHGIGAYLIFALFCGVGEICAIASFFRGERPPWLSVIGVGLNLTAVIPPIIVLNKGGS